VVLFFALFGFLFLSTQYLQFVGHEGGAVDEPAVDARPEARGAVASRRLARRI
jgi:hypothetical protein